jgi:adenine-specific DNA-methyltransferase
MDRRENLIFPIKAPDGTDILPKRQWWWGRERVQRVTAENGLVFTKTDNGWSVSYKQYLIDENGQKRGAKPFSVIDGIYTQHGTADLRAIFEDEVLIQFPKPVMLLNRLLQISGDKEAYRSGFLCRFRNNRPCCFEFEHRRWRSSFFYPCSAAGTL